MLFSFPRAAKNLMCRHCGVYRLVSLRGAKRRGNLDVEVADGVVLQQTPNSEIAAPFGLAMTAKRQDYITCVRNDIFFHYDAA